MHKATGISICCVTLLLGLAAAESGIRLTPVQPLFAWSNTDSLKVSSGALSVAYDVKSDPELALRKVLDAAVKPGKLVKPVAAVVAVVSDHLRADALRRPSNRPAVLSLQAMLTAAESAVSLPHVSTDGLRQLDIASLLLNVTEQQEILSVGCGAGGPKLEDVIARQSAESKPLAIVYCPTYLEEFNVSISGLEAEVAEVERLNALLESTGLPHLTFYTSRSTGSVVNRRRMQEPYTDYAVCGPLCSTQVSFIQSMVVITIAAVAIMIGLNCLNILDTPTRFEAPKETRD